MGTYILLFYNNKCQKDYNTHQDHNKRMLIL